MGGKQAKMAVKGGGGPGSLIPGVPGEAPARLSDSDRELWDRHFAGHASARNEIVEKYFGLVELNTSNVVKTIMEAIDQGDFRQAAVVGFLDAVDHYKENRELAFEEFSSLKIREAIMEEIWNYVRE